MTDKGMTGISNMVSHTFESCYRFMQLQLQHAKEDEQNLLTSSFLKQKMYSLPEPRLRSYGWEESHQAVFDVKFYDDKNKFKSVIDEIVWNDGVKNLLQTNVNTHIRTEDNISYKEKIKAAFGMNLDSMPN